MPKKQQYSVSYDNPRLPTESSVGVPGVGTLKNKKSVDLNLTEEQVEMLANLPGATVQGAKKTVKAEDKASVEPAKEKEGGE